MSGSVNLDNLYTSGLARYMATVANETGPRVGICMGQQHIGQGWHLGATTGVFSAAAAAALRDQRKHWPPRETHLPRARWAKLYPHEDFSLQGGALVLH